MNKQEAIKKLESIKVIGNDALAACYNESINAGITLMKKLDEPQKPVVPKLVAEWIELCKEKADLISCLSGSYEYDVNQYKRITEDEDWLFEADHQELVARAWLYGYEVEKEPLYYVIFPLNRWDEESGVMETHLQYLALDITSDETRFFSMPREDVGSYRTKLTKIQIESVDERFLAFAVPVEEVAEG